MKFGLLATALIAVLIVLYLSASDVDGGAQNYRLATVSRGPIASVVAASATLNAVVTVDVGTQISGMIKSLSADFNSQVDAGQVIARVDAAPFEARLSQAEAELAVARANVGMQEAALEELAAELLGERAALTEAEDELERTRSLHSRGGTSSSTLDAALSRYKQAQARVRAREARLARQRAQIERARAEVRQRTAAVRLRRIDLENTYIRSPVDGIVISRHVDAGQTVSASLQTPVLFRIAQDLNVMEVEISVDEADIGQIRAGQKVFFTVDSFPTRRYQGQVHQVRKGGQLAANVVTYTVVAIAENADHSLLPGMTANVSIVVAERDDVLKVPTAAVYFRPPGREAPSTGGDKLWVLDDTGEPRSISVVLGVSDGIESELLGGDLREGEAVIVGVDQPLSADTGWFEFGR